MHLHEGPGDILVFLTGSEECEQASKVTIYNISF
jgi:HrpA-like RNA helicase